MTRRNRIPVMLAALFPAMGLASSLVPPVPVGPPAVTPVLVRWRASDALARGVEMWASGRHRAALAAFETAARERPADPVCWHNLGVALLAASRYEEAMRCFHHERFSAPVAPSAHFGLGRCLLALGRPAEAENEFAVAIMEAPRELLGWHWLSAARVAQGKPPLSAAVFHAVTPPRARPRRVGWSADTISQAITRLRFPRLPTMGRAPGGYP